MPNCKRLPLFSPQVLAILEDPAVESSLVVACCCGTVKHFSYPSQAPFCTAVKRGAKINALGPIVWNLTVRSMHIQSYKITDILLLSRLAYIAMSQAVWCCKFIKRCNALTEAS